MHVPGSICKGEHRLIDAIPHLLALEKKFTPEIVSKYKANNSFVTLLFQ